jgi:uncharacterized protein YjiS (DUF1127 family)
MAGSVPSIPYSTSPASATFGRAATGGGHFGRLVVRMWQVRRERRMLLALDDRMLKDIGVNSGDVARETSRAPWDLPRR